MGASFLEWQVSYFPSGKVDGDTLSYDADDWRYDGHDYHWQGQNEPQQENKINVTGRSILTPHAAQLFQGKINQYLTDHAAIDSKTLREMEQTVSGWDVLSQSLSGLTDALVMRRELATFAPDGAGDSLPQSDPAQATSPPSPGALIGRNYRNVPLQGGLMTLFYPFRAGFFQIEQLRVVDTFGQKIDLHEMSAERIFEPKPGLGLKPDHADELDANMFQLPPRLVQPSRLDFQFLANDDSGLDITVAQTPHAVCGWLIPDHLDGGLAVYSSKGEAWAKSCRLNSASMTSAACWEASITLPCVRL